MIRIALASLLAAIVAVAVRWPVCNESLWVDELHSAWAVWGDRAEVAPRAAIGNQTPWYFYGLWWWRQGVEDSEVALRLPSVVATALAAAVLVVGVARNGGGLLGGAIAGLLMAVDRNAIFFGTEARPYGLVVLAVAVAAWCGVERRRIGSRWARWGLVAACFAGFLVHVTAAIPLAVLVTLLYFWPAGSRRGGANHFSLTDFLAVVVAMGLVLWINRDVIFHVWEDRSQWSAFGRPRSMRELWTIWPWVPLALLPVGFFGVARLGSARSVGWGRGGTSKGSDAGGRSAVHMQMRAEGHPSMAMIVLAAALVVTAVAWAASCWGWAPIWHRRFMIGVLPLLCWTAGGFWGAGGSLVADWGRQWRSRLVEPAVGIATVAVAIGGLLFSQGTIQQWLRGDPLVVRRGEDWRGAVEFLKQNRQEGDPVLVASELLESRRLNHPGGQGSAGGEGPDEHEETGGPGMREYLSYPLRSLYRVGGVAPLGTHDVYRRQRIREEMRRRASEVVGGDADPEDRRWDVWVVMRMRGLRALSSVEACKNDPVAGPHFDSVEARHFGGVAVVRFRFSR